MGRETLEIVAFNAGLVTGASAEEIPDDACVDGSENLDHEAPEGILQGRTADEIVEYDASENVAGSLIIGATIENSDGTVDLFYVESGATTPKRAPGYPNGGVPSSTGFGSITGIVSMIPTGVTLRLGATTPAWIGNLAYAHYWDQASPGTLVAGDYYGWITAGAALSFTGLSPGSAITVGGGSGDVGGLVKGRTYVYRLAYIYDGFQIGPMAPLVFTVDMTFDYGKIVIQPAVTASQVPYRATDIAIFRAENVGPRTSTSQGITSAYNYVGKVSLNTDAWSDDTGGVWSLSTPFEDVGQNGGTYEDLTGIPETIALPTVTYKYGAVVNSRFCVIQCTRSEYSDANFMMFVSRPLNYDTFNYLDDFVRLPFYPVAVMGFRNRCFVFGATSMAIVNLEGMIIEEMIEGIGCKGQASVFATEFGLFWMDANGIYMHDGQQAHQIGAAILPSLKTWLASGTFTAQFHAKWKSVLFMKHGTTSVTCYAFNLVRKRWDYLTLSTGVTCSPVSIHGAAGVVIIPYKGAASSDWALNVGADSQRYPTWVWISKKFHMGLPSQHKFLNNISIREPSGDTTLTWSLDGAAFVNTLTQDTQAHTVQVKIVGIDTYSVVDSLAIRYRMPIGRR
jgi:hypothetical protein